MNTNPLTKGVLSENFSGIGTVTPEMVQRRAAELAVINDRSAGDSSTADYEQARRELTGDSEIDPHDAELEAIPESERADTTPSSSGRKLPVSGDEDEDEDGRSLAEQLVEQGVNEAEHNQMLEAGRAARQADPDEKTKE